MLSKANQLTSYFENHHLKLIAICFSLFSYGCSTPDEAAPRRVSQPVYQQPIPQYQQPYRNPYYYGQPNPVQQRPNSRSYYNPYEFQQPQYNQSPYPDYEQYYVPPAQYYNNEQQAPRSGGSNEKT